MIQLKIDGVQKQNGELRSHIEDCLEQMEEALPLAKHFQEAHAEFLSWASKVEPELRALELGVPDEETNIEVHHSSLFECRSTKLACLHPLFLKKKILHHCCIPNIMLCYSH